MPYRSTSYRQPDWIDALPQAFLDYLGDAIIDEVECIIPDIAGMSRGKAMPVSKFDPTMISYLPSSLFYQTISGEYVTLDIEGQWLERDIVLRPDMTTACAVPWAESPTLQVISDLETREGDLLDIAPRSVLKRVLKLYEAQNWLPIVAPEIEFYLTRPNPDPTKPIEPPVGRTGRKGASRQAYSMDSVDDYGPVIDTIYDYAYAQGLEIDTIIQEGGAGQVEINLQHGNPLRLADQVFYFKRSIREAALKNNLFATFMAKPMRDEPGSAMHIHQSVVNKNTGENIFVGEDGSETDEFYQFIGGSQRYLPEVMPLLAPYVNSYRRYASVGMSAPTNLEWAADNRTTGLRIPASGPEARRIENRVIGIDCNPYLAIAASLACGYLGMVNHIPARPPAEREVFETDTDMPNSMGFSLEMFDGGRAVREILGENFCTLYAGIKKAEHQEYQMEISPWERQHLLLKT